MAEDRKDALAALEGLAEEEEFRDDTPVDTAQDIDPHAWLDHEDATVTSRVKTRAGWLRIAGITEEELDPLIRRSRKPDKVTRTIKLDPYLLRRWLICASVNKAYGWASGDPRQITPDNKKFMRKLTGELTTIQKAVQDLSELKMEDKEVAEALS